MRIEVCKNFSDVLYYQTLVNPEDIANVVSFLLSPASRHITGENIRVCGGEVML